MILLNLSASAKPVRRPVAPAVDIQPPGPAKPASGPPASTLDALFRDDSPRIAWLRKLAETSLLETVARAEARLDKIIRNSFRVIDGGRR
jgi:hypothetical protein